TFWGWVSNSFRGAISSSTKVAGTMIRVRVGNILESRAQTLVNTVNCVGVMGAGIALEFKKQFPEYYRDYKQRCDAGKVKLGRPYLYKRLGLPWILSFLTKDHWRSMTRLSDLV